MKNQGTEWLRHLPKVTQLVSSRAQWNPGSPAPKSERPPVKTPQCWKCLLASRGNFETRGGPQNRAQGPSVLLGPPRPPHWAARPALPCWPDQPPLLFSVSLTPTHTSSLLKPPKPTPGSSRFPLHCLPTEPLPVPRFLPHQHSVAAHQTSGSLSCQHPQEELGFE